MSNHRYSKFWWQDWRNDAALQVCSLAARGLWIEMLAIAHEGDPVGHVTINGKPPTPKQVAAIVRSTEKEVTKLLRELEDAGVFSRSDAGAIYSRRMVRDAEISAAGAEYVSKRRDRSPPNTPPTNGGYKGSNKAPSYSIDHRSESETESRAPRDFSSFKKWAADRSEPPSASPDVAALVSETAKVVKMRAYPPGRFPQRTAQEQQAAVKPRTAKPAHLTPEQLAQARKIAR